MRTCPDHDILQCPMKQANPVWGKGPSPCAIMLIGEAPGQNEDAKGEPFVGKSGRELDMLYLRKCAGILRANIYVTNLVKCRTNDRDRDPTEAEIAACSTLLRGEITKVRPQFIGTIGRFSTRFLLGESVAMEKVHGFGYRLQGVSVMPLYHPAFGLHNTTMMRHIMQDFRRFGRMVRGDEGVYWKERGE